MAEPRTIGNTIAPPLFIGFFLLLIAAGAAGVMIAPWWIGVMLGFDVAALIFLAGCLVKFRHSEHDMRIAALENDGNRVVLLIIAFALSVVVLVAVGAQLAGERMTVAETGLTILTLLIAWLFANMVYRCTTRTCSTQARMADRTKPGSCFPGRECRGSRTSSISPSPSAAHLRSRTPT